MAIATRTLWRIFSIGFALAIAGAFILLNPTLEFKAVDTIEHFHLPIGIVGAFAVYAEYGLFFISAVGLLSLAIRHVLSRRSTH